MISPPQVLKIRLPETPPASPPDVKRPPRLSPRRPGYSPGDEFDLPLRLRSPLGPSAPRDLPGVLATVASTRSTSVQTNETDSRQTEIPVQYRSMATQTDKVYIIPGTTATASPQFLLSSRVLSRADSWDQSPEEAPSTASPPSSPTGADQPRPPCLNGKPVSAPEIESLAARIAAYDLSGQRETRAAPSADVPQIDWRSGAAEFWKGQVEPLAILLGGGGGGRADRIVISAGTLGPPWKAAAEIRGRLPDAMFRYVLPASHGLGVDDDGWEDVAEDNGIDRTGTAPEAKKRRREEQNVRGGGRGKRSKVVMSPGSLGVVSSHTLGGREAAISEDCSEWMIELDLPGWELGSLW
ncbi:uncharacterized protein E0L32_010543 [Thyridium curvatum]|uniref:Uncharacterized protein n=1 Tax=Thyridium curvatum TaxID=1093900 RepID=A0A507AS77_9PEZI|nr:uncharacterized protein E0L32_010543 [Thyridium curvatum]TPX07751.1 hypothetical protein E0L32_010543 [Thyridium curvatum]